MKIKKSDTRLGYFDNDLGKTILNFPVVGIGASAGGLEALQEFFKNMIPKPDAAFVIIQHLSPDYKSFMNELLSRYTSIKIEIVTDGMALKSNCIYLIPPKMNMTIFHGVLYLNELSATRTLNLPIDIFFRSLAKDQEKNAVGIILSGAGSDGTLGIKAIKEFGGMTMAQDEKSAKFESMPHSSIFTGMVDIIMPPKQLAKELINYIKHPFVKENGHIESILASEQSQLSKVIAILSETKNVDFSCYKENTIIRRLEKRLSLNRFEKIEEYIKFLINNSKEINILFNELLIGVTRFFRDEAAFNSLKNLVISKIIESSLPNKEIRIWVAACSTGEEAYSLAILFKECMIELNIKRDIKIFATDLDTNSLEYASSGFYPDNIVSDVSADRLSKYFSKREGGYQVNDSIRTMIVFARQNIINDPPFSRLDLISCRNFLIYVNPETQQKIFSLFNIALNENGHLFLGSSESLGNMSEGYKSIDNKSKIFQKLLNYKPTIPSNLKRSSDFKQYPEILHVSSLTKNRKVNNRFLEVLFDQIMIDYLPPSVVIDENYDVLHTINNVNDYLSIPSGQITINLLKMLSKENSIFVSSLIRRAAKSNDVLILENVESKIIGKQLCLSCKKITDKLNGNIYYIVSFNEKDLSNSTIKPSKTGKLNIQMHYNERIDELEKELQVKSESLQATVEELETSNEELQSSNEELIASNEELQSTNEELQSVNEELYTVNSEHIRKIEELTELTSDVENLLKNTQIGTLYLDQHLVIRKINDVASKLTNIISTDIGRPLKHLSLNNFDTNLISEIERVSYDLQLFEKEIIDNKGKCYLMSIIPYRTVDNAVEGIIVTFVNITKLKREEALKLASEARYRSYIEVTGQIGWVTNAKGEIVEDVPSLRKFTGQSFNEVKGIGWTKALHPDDLDRTLTTWNNSVLKKTPYEIEYRMLRFDGIYRYLLARGFPIFNEDNSILEWVGTCIDITERKLAEEQLIRSEKELKKAQQITHIGSWHLDLATNEVQWTEELYKMYGFDPSQPPPPYTEHQKLFTDESWETLSTSLASTRSTGIPYELELKTLRIDGSNGWMWVRGETILDKEGKTIGLWGAAQDITDRKRVESALEMGGMSWWEWDCEFNKFKTGTAKYSMLGYTKEEIGNGFEAWTKYIHPDDYPKAMTAMKDHLEGKADNYFIEYWIKHKNGNYLWCRDKGAIVGRNEHGKPKLLRGIVMNITNEKRE
ncbi:MAG: two-component system chemotaxis family CheB/CheR fusion protein [Bacteroidetes bacterium]|nr:MAG: two-component system chemotaxis family CheB/CheR fusion protein [Bacteroidota bacterium]